ncbi:MAG: diguanylate cyclase [Candidatus Omnitrophica bacterium]|nr:diguanylate cyclase [Candidatus Omnitrophota bacterium]
MAEGKRLIISIGQEALAGLPDGAYKILDEQALVSQHEPKTIANLEKKVFDFFTLSQVGKSFLSIQKIDDLSYVFLSSVYETSDAANCALFLYDEEDMHFKCIKTIGLDPLAVGEVKFKKEEGLFWQILNSGEPFPITDSFGNYRFESVIKKWGLDKVESQIWVPLIVKNMLVGILTMGKKRDGSTYKETELSFILQMGNQAAVALESSILDAQKERASRELAKKMENLSVLYSVSKALNFAADLKKILLFILDKARDIVGAQKASLMLLDEKSKELVVNVVRGVPPDVENKINNGEMECTRIKIGEGVAGEVVMTKKHVLVNETSKDERFKKTETSFVDSILCMPLLVNEEVIGVINLTNKQKGGKFNEDDIELLSTLAGQAAITIHNARLYHLAITDGLTQLKIHRYFQQRLEEEVIRAERYKHPLSLIISDIDHFKKFNDTYGHQQGDIVLIEVAKICRLNVRSVDIPARYGGEEFAFILPETDLAIAKSVAERIRQKVEAEEIPSKSGKLKVTISLGVSAYPQHGTDPKALIEAADKALYRAKEAGRNRVEVAS